MLYCSFTIFRSCFGTLITKM